MNKIASFVRLDLYTLKPYRKSLLLLLALAGFMTMMFQSLTTLSFYLMFSVVMVMVYPFSVGETNRLDTLYSTLSLRRRNIVMGRYVFAFCMELAAVLLILILSWGFTMFTDMEFVVSEIGFNLCLTSFLFTVIVSVQHPLYFKLGYNKAKLIAYTPLVIICIAVLLFAKVMKNTGIELQFEQFVERLTENPVPVYGIFVLAGHLVLLLSCKLSCGFYGRRDI